MAGQCDTARAWLDDFSAESRTIVFDSNLRHRCSGFTSAFVIAPQRAQDRHAWLGDGEAQEILVLVRFVPRTAKPERRKHAW
jgi:hypothetical protein